jgi:hypothetical protein
MMDMAKEMEVLLNEVERDDLLAQYKSLTAERDTLKALCVEHLTELDYLREQTRFNSEDRERWRAMADRARSILK